MTASSMRLGRAVVRIDAAFLVLSGSFGLVADLASHFGGIGPFGAVFLNDPTVIGVVEAHGLAIFTGMAACVAITRMAPRYWHAHLAATHLLLGGANAAFFEVFEQVGARGAGIAVTAVHFALVLVQTVLALRPARAAAAPRPT